VDSVLFNLAAERLEHHTSLDRMEARGTLRIALKEAGLDLKRVTPGELCVVLAKVMPRELETRGVGDPAAVCNAVTDDLVKSSTLTDTPPSSDPYVVFRRLRDA
jgi:hypothetical protein